MKFEINKRALENIVNDGMKKVTAHYQRVFDRVLDAHGGEPAEAVLAVLGPKLRAVGWTASDEDLRPYAEAISQRTRIKLEPGRAKL